MSTTQTWRYLYVGLLSGGAGLLAWGVLQTLVETVSRWRLFRTGIDLRRLVRTAETTPYDPYGLEHLPWEGLRLLGAIVGVGITAALFAERSPYLVVLGLTGGYVPSLVREYLQRRKRQEIENQVRHFLRFLGSTTELYGGLFPALRAIADYGAHDLIIARLRLHLRVATRPEEALDALATDLRSPTLALLTRRLAETERGQLHPEEALTALLRQAERESVREAKRAIGGAPVRLLIPMLFLMVPPILVLTLYPAVARLLVLIAGTGETPVW